MKKILLLVACVMTTLTVSAQRAESRSSSFFSTERAEQPVTFGIRGGVNFATMNASTEGYSFSPDSRTGFNLGVCVDIPMMESLYLQSGLYYTVKGYKLEDDGETEKATPAYLEIPVLASYRYNFSDFTQLQINVGPYFAYGIGGKSKWEDEQYGEEEEVDFFDDYTKKFDFGLQFGAGVTLGHFFVGMNYDLGLTNIVKDSDDYKLKNRCFSINVGYNF